MEYQAASLDVHPASLIGGQFSVQVVAETSRILFELDFAFVAWKLDHLEVREIRSRLLEGLHRAGVDHNAVTVRESIRAEAVTRLKDQILLTRHRNEPRIKRRRQVLDARVSSVIEVHAGATINADRRVGWLCVRHFSSSKMSTNIFARNITLKMNSIK